MPRSPPAALCRVFRRAGASPNPFPAHVLHHGADQLCLVGMHELARLALNWDSRRPWSLDGLSDEGAGASPGGALPVSCGSPSPGQLIRSGPIVAEVSPPAPGLGALFFGNHLH
eukprot:1751674-Lingulodinium_polyedra.AAC.1